LYFRRNQSGDSEKAREHLERALAISRPRGHHRATIDYLRTYGEILQDFGRTQEACAAWKYAISLQKALRIGPDEQQWFLNKLQSASCEV
jgi:tetratricopeptide (TPR) repeat protein